MKSNLEYVFSVTAVTRISPKYGYCLRLRLRVQAPCRWNTCWTKASVKGQIAVSYSATSRFKEWRSCFGAFRETFPLFESPGPNCEWGGGTNGSAGWQKISQQKWRLIAVAVMGNRCGAQQGRLACQDAPRWRNTDIWTIKPGTGSPGDCRSHMSLLLPLQRTGVHTWFPTNGSEIKARLV